MFISEKPVINSFSFPKALAEGMHVIITCSILTGDPPISIRWLKDGMTLNKKMLNIEESSMGHLGSSLIFNSVGRSHNGNYTCLAENKAGETNFSAPMQVNGELILTCALFIIIPNIIIVITVFGLLKVYVNCITDIEN